LPACDLTDLLVPALNGTNRAVTDAQVAPPLVAQICTSMCLALRINFSTNTSGTPRPCRPRAPLVSALIETHRLIQRRAFPAAPPIDALTITGRSQVTRPKRCDLCPDMTAHRSRQNRNAAFRRASLRAEPCAEQNQELGPGTDKHDPDRWHARENRHLRQEAVARMNRVDSLGLG